MAIISINGNSLDPKAPTLAAFNLVDETAKGSNYILIQTNGPLTKDIKKDLAEKWKVEIQEKVSEDTYLCRYTPEDLSSIRGLPYVTYANIYQSHFVIESRLKVVPAGSSQTSALLPAPVRTESPVDVDVEFHRDVVETPQLIEALAAAARLDPECLEMDGDKARITVQRRYLSDVADLDQVKSINQVHPVKLHNNVARGILRLDEAINPNPPNTKYEGEGQIVCVADTGFAKGSLKPADVPNAFKAQGVPPTVRVVALYALGRTNPNRSSDPDGHGTHVCGSVLGSETSTVTRERIQGTAPQAKLVMQSLLDANGGLGGIPRDLRKLFATPYKSSEHPTRIHSNSWGSAPDPFFQIEYNNQSKAIDDFMDKHRDMVILFAAGNDGMDTDPRNGVVDPGQVGSQAAAKNCISVGASESHRPNNNVTYSQFGYPALPLGPDRVANDARGMAAFSSRGPTREGRIKPDVVAPGTCILSTLSSLATALKDWGVSADPGYMYLGGTSMATPLVAGCCAVLRETLVKNRTPNPSAALIKALLINGAVELAGQYIPSEAGRSPNDASGWGRVDVANSIIIPTVAEAHGILRTDNAGYRDEATPLDTFDEFVFELPINGAGRTLKITLVWTDPAGPSLQNDLDLIVVAPGDKIERHGNRLGQEFPYKTKKTRDEEEKATPRGGHESEPYDRKNNVEQVVWEGIPEGKAKVVVRAHNVSSLKGQTFALAWKVY
ncbi:peptidase S8/S53 domain-containing protein [Chaetomium sp. MPI-CAGE-AT-0009]|nr:peptidase S8/S53 domain-containing protein [Chaetomium sp. MPI-CAGE-AT-0009]